MTLRRVLSRIVLAFVTFVISLGASEICVRWIDRYPLFDVRLPARPTPAPERSLREIAAQLPRPDDVDPAWIDDAPPPLSNRKAPPPELLALQQHGVERGGLESNLYRQWNRVFAATSGCRDGEILQSLPSPLLAFDPPETNGQPVYRSLLATTTPLGLVTNRFGWRGPEIAIDKPPQTIRLAFLGASTTIGAHWLPYSYPEYVLHWLNLWAKQSGLAVQFDGINAGREGLISASSAAIVRQELLPMEPDFVVYYEGANQFLFSDLLDIRVERPKQQIVSLLPDRWADVVFVLRPYFALARRFDQAAQSAAAGNGLEPRKPSYHLRWPATVDEMEPDISRRELPLQLPNILKDLDSIREDLGRIGAELAVSSFVWLVADGLELPSPYTSIYTFLNVKWWPYRYADLRRMADFQNRVLARYAASRDLLFIDEAAFMPRSPEYFMDAVHFNREGTRMQAWGIFTAILPRVRERIASGAWPRPDRERLDEHPGIRPPRRYDGCTELLAGAVQPPSRSRSSVPGSK